MVEPDGFSDGPSPFPWTGYETNLRGWIAASTSVGTEDGHLVFRICPDQGEPAEMADIRAGFVRLAPMLQADHLNAAWVEYAGARLEAELSRVPVPQPDPPS